MRGRETWPRTAIFVLWDDWGGLADHVEPPVVERWDDGTPFRYGYRTPLLVISPLVVGSGFGGAITACRLAQAGMRVCILERGRAWTPDQYPLHNRDPGSWFWTNWSSGLYQYHRFGSMDVLVASGVGGGSLVHANVLMTPPAEVFSSGWPASITLSALAPYYQRVREVLHPTPYPRASARSKTTMMQRGR